MSGPEASAARFCLARARAALLAAMVFACLACSGLSGATARAAVNPLSLAGIGGPSLGLGVTDSLFLDSASGPQDVWLSRARNLGSRWIRIDALWRGIAPFTQPHHFNAADPGDPAYNWSALDAAVSAAVAHGQTPMINAHSAPSWAEGPGRPSWAQIGTWDPTAGAFRAFAQALAKRYSGHFPDPHHPGHHLPRVRYFQAWNEPNLLPYLSPQWVQDSHGRIIAYSPGLYRSLLNAFYAGVKSVDRADHVFAAGTAPFGDPPGQGQGRMSPVTFLEGLFCLNSSLRRTGCPGGAAHLDGLDHHVYSPPWYGAAVSTDISVPDLGKIWQIVNAARRAHTVTPGGAKPLWITEVAASATPPNAFNLTLQAHYLDEDLYEFWSEHVSNVFWFSIQDPGLAAGSFFAYVGLYGQNDAAKPAAAAYQFPFVALPHGANHLTLWGRAPRTGTVIVQRLAGGHWRTFARVHTTRGAIFFTHVRARGAPVLRATIAGAVSPSWVAGF